MILGKLYKWDVIFVEFVDMSLKELEELKLEIEEEIKQRKIAESGEYEFEFRYSNDPRKSTPYAARLFLDENDKIERDFFDLNREYGKNSVAVYGTYTAKDLDIIEERHGGSWKKDHRYWFLIHDGEKIQVADINNASEKARVKEYMKGVITEEELLYGN